MNVRRTVQATVLGVAVAGALIAFAFERRASRDHAGPGAKWAMQEAMAAAHRPGSTTVHAEGRVITYPGASVVVGAQAGGLLRAVLASEGSSVSKGQLLAELDGDEQRAALDEARARMREADVSIRFLRTQVERSRRLFASETIAQDALDRSQHELDVASARRAVASATAARLSAAESKTHVVSPIDGVVLERFVEPGETVAPGARIVTVADVARMRVEAEVDEYDAARVGVGAAVVVSAEGTKATWPAKVEEVPQVVTSRRLKPQDPARPTDTRVLLVKVALAAPAGLKLGQRVEVEIAAPATGDTGAAP